MSRVKVYIADDHTLFRNAFKKVLQDLDRVGEIKEASNGKELLTLICDEIPDIVILDIEMPIMDGIKACEKIASAYPEVKIIAVSMHDNKLTIYQALQAGVHAYLPKVTRLSDFQQALNTIIDGRPYTNQSMLEALRYVELVNRNSTQLLRKTDLSEKEKTIIRLICRQLTNRQIALELSLSEHTVRNHRVRMMRKTGSKNTQGLVSFAYESGLFT